jgi:ABC-type antimicrobial peptide transport system permease subunit
VESARDWQYGSMRVPLLMLLAATAFVLSIACVNIANLTWAQAIARSGEFALRLALGGTRGDVLRLHLAELLIIFLSGLIPGLLLASAAVPGLLAINPTIARASGAVEIDWRVQLFSVAVAMLMAIGASAGPAIRAMRGEVSAAISGSVGRATQSARASDCNAPWSPSRSRYAWRC